MSDFRKEIIKAATQKFIFTLHAIDEMNNEDDIISTHEVRRVIFEGEIIEDYPEDRRGHSCLMLGFCNRPVHVVCAPKQEYLAIITAYIPDLNEWQTNFKKRKER